MIKKKFFTLLLVLGFVPSVPLFAEDITVLLRLKKSEQPDSLGCNFVQQVSKLTYNLLLDNKIKLWDTPAKEIQITASSLKEIEKSTETSFIEQEIIFIHEYWTQNKRDITSKTIGITFLNRDARGNEVAYGYVDFADLREAFSLNRIEANADGNYGETFTYYLTTKRFVFNIVQFNNKVLSNVTESQDVLQQFKGKLEFNTSASQYYGEQVKMITYTIDAKSTTDSAKHALSKAIFFMLEFYLTENKEEFYNLGGDKFQSFVNEKNKLKVTGVEVNEMWKKNGTQIYYEPKSVTIFVNDSALNTIPLAELVNMDLNVYNKKFVLALLEKQFNLVITQINSQKISKREAYLYHKGLQTFNWSQVIEFVKYY